MFKGISLISGVVLFALAVLFTPSFSLAADESQCPSGGYSDLVANVKERNADMQKLSDEKFKILLAKLEERSGRKIDANGFLISHIEDGPIAKVGVALMKDQCIVPGSMFVFEAAEYVQFLNDMGLSWSDFEMVISPAEA